MIITLLKCRVWEPILRSLTSLVVLAGYQEFAFFTSPMDHSESSGPWMIFKFLMYLRNSLSTCPKVLTSAKSPSCPHIVIIYGAS